VRKDGRKRWGRAADVCAHCRCACGRLGGLACALLECVALLLSALELPLDALRLPPRCVALALGHYHLALSLEGKVERERKEMRVQCVRILTATDADPPSLLPLSHRPECAQPLTSRRAFTCSSRRRVASAAAARAASASATASVRWLVSSSTCSKEIKPPVGHSPNA